MKRIFHLLFIVFLAVSCSMSMDYLEPEAGLMADDRVEKESHYAVVTLKKDAEGLYFQMDDQVTAEPLNRSAILFDGETRCMISYRQVIGQATSPRTWRIVLDWMEPLETFGLEEITQTSYEASIPEEDPVDLHPDSWMTVLEDGYLTLHYTVMSGGEKAHRFRLLYGGNPADPFELRLVHDRCGDPASYPEEGIVAFRLSGLPDTEGVSVPLTLKYKPLNGTSSEATARFDYRTRK